jgi:DNA polymerase I-like protein with 3'-5' exonuclease and polymerase domains
MIYSLDIETTSLTADKEDALHPHLSRILLIAVYNTKESYVFESIADFKAWHKEAHQYIFHNHQFDIKHLAFHGIDLRRNYYGDTMLQAVAHQTKIPERFLVEYEEKRIELNKAGAKHREAKRYSLKTLAPYWLCVEPFWEVEDKNNKDYAALDAKYTHDLYFKLQTTMLPECLNFYNTRLLPWSKMLLEATLTGIGFNMTGLAELKQTMQSASDEYLIQIHTNWGEYFEKWKELEYAAIDKKYTDMLEKALAKGPKDPEKTKSRYEDLKRQAKINADVEFNINSPSQIMWLLRDQLNYPVTNLLGKESTGVDVLEMLAAHHPEVKSLLDYRGVNKILTAFIPAYEKFSINETIYPNYNMSGARTGRLSSSNPNAQQCPPEIDKLFIPRPGMELVTFDESAIEPRILAHYTADPVLLDIFQNNHDFHGYNAKQFFALPCTPNEVKTLYPKERAVAKTLGLATVYGAGKNRIKIAGLQAGFTFTNDECKRIYDNIRKAYSKSFEYKILEVDNRLQQGEILYNLFGRPVVIQNPDDIYMKGLNTLIQSSASDLVLEAATRIQRAFHANNWAGGVKLLVHDSITVEYPVEFKEKVLDIIQDAMVNFKLDNVPLKVEKK